MSVLTTMEALLNATTNSTTSPFSPYLPQNAHNVVLSTIFSVIIFIGVVGNGLLIWTVAANKSMHSVPNIFLVSLAIGDLAVLIFAVPFRMLLYFNIEWVYGVAMCHIFEFTIHLSEGVSIFTLTALAGDRFVAIVLPMQTFLWASKKKAILISISIWLIAFLFALPDIITSDIILSKLNFDVCQVYSMFLNEKNQPDDNHPYVLSRRIINFSVYFIIPLIIISIFYIVIAYSLNKKQNEPIKDTMKMTQSKIWQKQVRARKKIAKIILVITAMFVVCWAPRYIYVFLSGYHVPSLHFSKMRYFKSTSYILSFLNSCINPPSLYFMSADFKRYFNHYLFGRCSKRMRISKYYRNSITSNTLHTHIANTAISFEDLAIK